MDGNTKREAPISWRPSKAAAEKLAHLVAKTGLSRNDLLNRVILDYGATQVTEVHSAKTLANETVPAPHEAKPPRPVLKINRPDPDKIAAFQRKAGMGGAGKR